MHLKFDFVIRFGNQNKIGGFRKTKLKKSRKSIYHEIPGNVYEENNTASILQPCKNIWFTIGEYCLHWKILEIIFLCALENTQTNKTVFFARSNSYVSAFYMKFRRNGILTESAAQKHRHFYQFSKMLKKLMDYPAVTEDNNEKNMAYLDL